MKTKMKKTKKQICFTMAFCIILSILCVIPATDSSAKESVGNGLILSTDAVTVTTDSAATFTAALGQGFDASRLACIVADPRVASITPVAYASNVAAFQVNYGNGGSTIAAIYSLDNPAVVAYLAVNATPLIMDIPAKLTLPQPQQLLQGCKLCVRALRLYLCRFQRLSVHIEHTIPVCLLQG